MNNNLPFDKQFFKDFWQLLKPYWFSNDNRLAIALFTLTIICIVGEIVGHVGFNQFHRDFFNALEHFDQAGITAAFVHFAMVAVLYTVALTGTDYFCNLLGIRWRRWLTNQYLQKWLHHRAYYHMPLQNTLIDNPDQRISEDLENFPVVTLILFKRFLHSFLLLSTFSFILWELSNPISFTIATIQLVIPGYFCIVAVLCALVGTVLIKYIGKNMAQLEYNKQQVNADFRFGLIRIRESSEQIAVLQGELTEHHRLKESFKSIYANSVKLAIVTAFLFMFNKLYAYGYHIISFLISIPLYLAKTIPLGSVTQISSAFNSVASGFSVIVETYNDLANWRSIIFRISEFNNAMSLLDETNQPTIEVNRSLSGDIQIENLQLTLPNGDLLLGEINLIFEAGKATLLCGQIGLGKSTLLRAIAGIWPYGTGNITLPDHATMLFLPQKPYMPLGTLREALLYPNNIDVCDTELMHVIKLCKLEKFKNQLNKMQNWSQTLSLGEQQLVSLARILLHKPAIALLDEASSAMDENLEKYMYKTLRDCLPQITLVSIGHRNSLMQLHDRIISLSAENSGRELNVA